MFIHHIHCYFYVYYVLFIQQAKVVVVGHSLGAGTAVVLSLLMKPQYPSTMCYAFGTPGSVLDANTAEECSSYVISCVLGYDMICRSSLPSLMRFRENVRIYISISE